MADIGLRTVPGSGFGGYGYMSPSPQNSTPMGVTQSFGQQLGDNLKQGLKGFVSGLPGGLMSAGLSALGSILQYNLQNKLMDKSIKANTDQWNAENQYNDPSAQMQRMMAAGLNPNLVAGSAATGNASQMTPSTNVPSASNPISNFASVQGALKSLQSADADIRLKNAQAMELESRAQKESAEKDVQASGWLPYLQQLGRNAGFQADVVQLHGMNLAKDLEIKSSQLRLMDDQHFRNYLDRDYQTLVNHNYQRYMESLVFKNCADAGFSYAKAQDVVNTFKQRMNLYTAQIGWYNQLAKTSEAQAGLYGAQEAATWTNRAYVQQQIVKGAAEVGFAVQRAADMGISQFVDPKTHTYYYVWDHSGFNYSDIDKKYQKRRNTKMGFDMAESVTRSVLNATEAGVKIAGAVSTGGLSGAVSSPYGSMTETWKIDDAGNYIKTGQTMRSNLGAEEWNEAYPGW